jgi:sec-independent protein translocase protein TatA
MINTIVLGIIGPWQIALIILALLLLFGGKKIPESESLKRNLTI